MAANNGEQPPAVLSVSPWEEDHLSLGHILAQAHGDFEQAGSCQEALEILGRGWFPVVICERQLPDGDWKTLLSATLRLEHAPLVVVSSGAADEHIWAEVLNLGGWDVLAKPFDAREVLWSVSMACQEWLRRQCAPDRSLVAATP